MSRLTVRQWQAHKHVNMPSKFEGDRLIYCKHCGKDTYNLVCYSCWLLLDKPTTVEGLELMLNKKGRWCHECLEVVKSGGEHQCLKGDQ